MSDTPMFAGAGLLAVASFFADGWARIVAWNDQPAMWAVLGTMLLISGLWALQPGARRGWRVLGIVACLAGLGFCVRLLPDLSGTIPVVLTFRLTASFSLVRLRNNHDPLHDGLWVRGGYARRPSSFA